MQKIATITPIVRQHAEDAAFMWFQRSKAIQSAEFGEVNIGRRDQRISAHLAGLLAAGQDGWEISLEKFEDFPESGEAFVLGYLALESGRKPIVAQAVKLVSAAGVKALKGFSGALAWVAADQLKPFAATWLASKDPHLRYFGLCALSHHRIDPKERLSTYMKDGDPQVCARALRLVGELGRQDLRDEVEIALQSETDREQFWAAWSLCLLGNAEQAFPILETLAISASDLADDALEMRILAGSSNGLKLWIRRLLLQKDIAPRVLSQLGATEDRALLPWIITQMRKPELAQGAGAAFRDFFKIDFDDTDLFTNDPSVLGEGFADLEDGPFPVADKIEAWLKDLQDHNGPGREPSRDPGTDPSLRQLRHAAIKQALRSAKAPLPCWQHIRHYPAWS